MYGMMEIRTSPDPKAASTMPLSAFPRFLILRIFEKDVIYDTKSFQLKPQSWKHVPQSSSTESEELRLRIFGQLVVYDKKTFSLKAQDSLSGSKSLSGLPSEVILEVFDRLQNLNGVCRLNATSHRIHSIWKKFRQPIIRTLLSNEISCLNQANILVDRFIELSGKSSDTLGLSEYRLRLFHRHEKLIRRQLSLHLPEPKNGHKAQYQAKVMRSLYRYTTFSLTNDLCPPRTMFTLPVSDQYFRDTELAETLFLFGPMLQTFIGLDASKIGQAEIDSCWGQFGSMPFVLPFQRQRSNGRRLFTSMWKIVGFMSLSLLDKSRWKQLEPQISTTGISTSTALATCPYLQLQNDGWTYQSVPLYVDLDSLVLAPVLLLNRLNAARRQRAKSLKNPKPKDSTLALSKKLEKMSL